jgi:prolipoprotein diacylglyceryl transferase
MHPVLFYVGPWPVPSHEAFIFLGVVAATVVFWVRAERQGPFDERLLWIVAGTLFAGAIGAKLGMGWRYVVVTRDNSLMGILTRGGRSIIGGLAGAYLGAVLTKRLVGYRRRTGDLFAPAVAIGMAIGRVGCFLSEQVGTPTTLPWGLRLSDDTLGHIPNCPYCLPGVALHPSFLYEIAFHAAMFVWLLLYWRPRIVVEGDLFKTYLLAYAIFRFFVEFVRGNPVLWNGLTGSQLFLVPSTLLLAGYFARRFWVDRDPRSPVVAEEVAG